jgi:GNAT superfamily N-acetyltransferase
VHDEVELSIRQFVDAWRVICAASPTSSAMSGDGLECVFSGLPIGFFNLGMLTGHCVSGDQLESLAREAGAWAADKQVPWLFVVTHERLQDGVDAPSRLEQCGFAPVMPLTGMHARHLTPSNGMPAELELVVPEDDGGCASLCDVNGAAYGMALEAAIPVVGRRAFWQAHVPVLGLVGGAPASCAAVLRVDGHHYVAMVATTPGQQRRGYAEAAMRRALDLADRANGPRPTVLHATDAGRPGYARMGYSTISSHTVFMEQRFLER